LQALSRCTTSGILQKRAKKEANPAGNKHFDGDKSSQNTALDAKDNLLYATLMYGNIVKVCILGDYHVGTIQTRIWMVNKVQQRGLQRSIKHTRYCEAVAWLLLISNTPRLGVVRPRSTFQLLMLKRVDCNSVPQDAQRV
jgi:hypothetical protein